MIRQGRPHRLEAQLLERGLGHWRKLPSKRAVADLVEHARTILFAEKSGAAGEDPGRAAADIELALAGLHEALGELIRVATGSPASVEARAVARATASRLVQRLPDIQRMLWSDVQAAYDGDPSLHRIEEAVACMPGVEALLCHRLAHALHELAVPILPRMIAEHAHSATGIDIHPGARIGERFFIDHGTGVVIGETAVIGREVRLYQGVTLGAKSFPVGEDGRLVKGHPRHPILEDGVVVYSGASILGRITIGAGATIGGNVWVTKDVAPGSVVTQAALRSTKFTHGAGI